MNDKQKNIFIFGTPKPVLRILIKILISSYNVFFVGYEDYRQYHKIKEMLVDNAYNINRKIKIKELFQIPLKLLKSKPKIVIIFGNRAIKNGIILLFTRFIFPKTKIVFFPYDICQYSFIREVKYRILGRLTFFFDRICYEKSDKVITKGFENELRYLKGIYKINKKEHFAFNQLIEKEHLVDKKNISINPEKIQLVYIGGISNSVNNMNNYKIFENLLQNKNMVLHIYSNMSNMLDGLKEKEKLVIHDHIKDHKELIKEISKYDFGLNLFEPSKNDFLQCKMASAIKNYDYFAAGLPVIVDSEHESMANIISKNKIGFEIRSKDIEDIEKYIMNCNYKELIENVDIYRNNMLVKESRIIEFLES